MHRLTFHPHIFHGDYCKTNKNKIRNLAFCGIERLLLYKNKQVLHSLNIHRVHNAILQGKAQIPLAQSINSH